MPVTAQNLWWSHGYFSQKCEGFTWQPSSEFFEFLTLLCVCVRPSLSLCPQMSSLVWNAGVCLHSAVPECCVGRRIGGWSWGNGGGRGEGVTERWKSATSFGIARTTSQSAWQGGSPGHGTARGNPSLAFPPPVPSPFPRLLRSSGGRLGPGAPSRGPGTPMGTDTLPWPRCG